MSVVKAGVNGTRRYTSEYGREYTGGIALVRMPLMQLDHLRDTKLLKTVARAFKGTGLTRLKANAFSSAEIVAAVHSLVVESHVERLPFVFFGSYPSERYDVCPSICTGNRSCLLRRLNLADLLRCLNSFKSGISKCPRNGG